MHIGQVARFGIFLKSASRLVPDGWVERKISVTDVIFERFSSSQNLTLGTKNFEIGPLVKKLQPFEVGRILVPMVQISMKFDD